MTNIATLTHEQKKKLCPVDEPKKPSRDPWWYCLLVPFLLGSFGLFLFNVPGIAFIQLHDLPTEWLKAFTIPGSILMMFGSDMGTAFALMEIFRKWGTKDQTWVDFVCLVVSVLASVSSAYLSWAWQINAIVVEEIFWLEGIQIVGPLVATVFIIVDLLASGAEAGLYLRDYGLRYRQWYEEEYRPSITRYWDMLDKGDEAGKTNIVKINDGVYFCPGKGYFVWCPQCNQTTSKYYSTERGATAAYGGHKGKCKASKVETQE